MTPNTSSPAPAGEGVQPIPRFALKPDVPDESVDGAWWPRSRSLPTELPALLSALSDLVGRVLLVGYHVSAWDRPPAAVEFDARVVLLESFSSEEPHTVLVVGTDGRRVALLVVPPDAVDATAQSALSAAARPGRSAREGESGARSLTEVAARLSGPEGSTNAHRVNQISNWVDEAAGQFAHAPVLNYVPILVEHLVRIRMASRSDTPAD